MVVAKAREHGVLDRGTVRRVEVERRHRERGIEAAIMKLCIQRKKKRKCGQQSVESSSYSSQPSIPENGRRIQGRARAGARRQTAQTQLRGRSNPHSRHPCTPPSRAIFNVHQFTAPTRTPSEHAILPASCTLHPTIAARGPGHLYCVVQQRPRLAEQERDTFYTTQGQLSTRAILRPGWTRNTRMSVAWHRLTRPPSSKKVPRPAVPRGGGDELAVWELT